MSSVKTAVSLDRSLFDQIEALAQEMNVPRSRVISLAVEDYLRRRENQQLLDQINAALEESGQEEEIQLARAMRRRMSRSLTAEW